MTQTSSWQHDLLPVKMDAPFRLMDLPTEVILMVFQQCPNIQTAKTLRLGCRTLNEISILNSKSIFEAQVANIIEPINDYYRYLTTLHLDPKQIRNPLPGTHWHDNWQIPSASFTTAIRREIPYLTQRRASLAPYITAACYLPGLYTKREATLILEHQAVLESLAGVAVKDSLMLTWGVNWMLDTQNAEIWELRGTEIVGKALDIRDFFDQKRRRYEYWRDVVLPGYDIGIQVLSRTSSLGSRLSKAHIDVLVSILKENGWPHRFDQQKAVPKIKAFIEWAIPKANIPRRWNIED